MDFKYKYFKYKKKYLELKKNGGGEEDARNYFIKFLERKENPTKKDIKKGIESEKFLETLYKTDKNLQSLLNEKNIEPIMTNSIKIFDIIKDGIDKKIIRSFIVIYLNQKMGTPSGIENKGRFIGAYENVNILRQSKKKDIKIPPKFDSLSDLEDFIKDNKKKLDEIKKIKEEKIKKNKEQRKIKLDGEKDVKIVLETDNVIIHNPTSAAGSRYYGGNTRWCTAAKCENMFDYYNNQGPLYIIKSKTTKKKFQLHYETDSLMDEEDKPINIETVIEILNNDTKFIDWLNDLILNKNKIIDKKLIIENNFWIPKFQKEHNELIEVLTFGDNFNKPLNNSLDNLTNLKELTFRRSFDQPLDNSLNKLTNLKELTLGRYFEQPLGDSLNKLKNLKKLTLKSNFPFENSLDELRELEELEINSLNGSLEKLTNLQHLKLGYYIDQPIGNLLDDLTNLKKLTIGSGFNKPLGDSLNKLTNLEELTFGFLYEGMYYSSFNKPLGDSLNKLKNLKKLNLSRDFDQPLGNSLDNLTNLEELSFHRDFNQPLHDSLNKLTNLEELIFNRDFNQPLDNSLKHLINLKRLIISKSYKYQESLDEFKGNINVELKDY